MISTAQAVRLLIRDPIRLTSQAVYGDGTASAFYLSGAPIYSGTAPTVNLVVGAGALSATGGTAWTYADGLLAFATALSANSAALANYFWSVLSEAELEFITAYAPTIDEMAMVGLQTIMADHAKMMRWSLAQGPSVDPAAAQQALQALWSLYNDKIITRHAEGGIESYSEYLQAGGQHGLVNYADSFWD